MKYNALSIYTFILVASFLSGCLKTEEQRYTVSGHIYQNCSRQPIANQMFAFYQVGGGGDIIDSAKTDANGYFTLSYVPKNGSKVRVGIPLNVGMSEYGQFLPGRDYPDIVLYKQSACYLKVSMQVFDNSYTNKDTLYIGDAGSGGGAPKVLKIAGPFVSHLLYAVPNYLIANYIYDDTYIPVMFRMNSKEFSQGQVKVKACDTVNYTIQIR